MGDQCLKRILKVHILFDTITITWNVRVYSLFVNQFFQLSEIKQRLYKFVDKIEMKD